MTPSYLDPRSGETFRLDVPRWCGTERAPLLLTPLPGIARDAVDTAARGLWRYRVALPFQPADPISMGEGRTPLLSRTLHGAPALLKCEWLMPTGSFKDRGASVMLSLLRDQGIRAVLEDSSGNGGAAVAAYAAAGGMHATILSPVSTSPAKTVQMRAHGAAVELVPGTRQDTADAAIARAETIFYASHNWHPFFLHGTKTLAYELWEDLGFAAPDNVIVPCGAGSNVLGCEIGFAELMRAGEIAAMPRLFAVQPGQLRADRRRLPGGRAGGHADIADHRRRHRDRAADQAAGSDRRADRNRGRRGDADRGRDRQVLPRPRNARLLCRADLRPGRRSVRQAAGVGRDHAGAAHRAGADRLRAEGDAAHR